MRKKTAYILIILILGTSYIRAQEALTNLVVNPKIKQLSSIQKKQKVKSEKAIIELPFIDDFAKSVGYPDSSLWENKYAFVNLTYAYDPPSIGVATLDAIDQTGSLYVNKVTSLFGADTLTSKQINLNYPGNNTIFLSFFYEPGGLGDAPDKRDSLILEYYSPDSLRWNKAWHVVFNEVDTLLKEYYAYNKLAKNIKGDTLISLTHKFQQVIIPVNEDQYLKNNFQFRFRNYASLSLSIDFQSKASNSDHWHIDFVILNKDRSFNDTIPGDFAICKPIGSLLKTYNSIPWTHFARAIAYEMEDSIRVTYRNLSLAEESPEKNFEITDLKGNTGVASFSGGIIGDVIPMLTQTYRRSIDYIFPYNTYNDSALFEVRSYIKPNNVPFESYRWNDTTRFLQKFYNYYAYDDGTAENGYGIVGESTENAMVAMQFKSYKKDTLRGVQIFFNQALENSNQVTFKIHVWKNDNGKPGSIIYTKEGVKPTSTGELNKFNLFVFDDIVIVDGEFFIGWQKQNTVQMLNVGFDVNTISKDKLYYNIAGTWIPSQFNGTVMIRPMFGHEVSLPTDVAPNPSVNNFDFTVYPNPVQDILNINIPDKADANYRYSVFNTYGRIFIDKVSNESSIDVSNLNSGIYFIRITDNKGASTTKKFIIIR